MIATRPDGHLILPVCRSEVAQKSLALTRYKDPFKHTGKQNVKILWVFQPSENEAGNSVNRVGFSQKACNFQLQHALISNVEKKHHL